MAITKNAPDYYIHDTALTFTPNYQDRDIVFVSIVSNAAIAVLKPGIPELGYAADAGYQRWSLTGYTTKLGTTGAYNIYARLSRSEKKAMIIFSVNDYNVDGSVAGGEASAEYWYIKIGDITASEGGVDRQLNYDSGILGTNRGMAESNTVLEKMFKWNSTDGTFTMQAYLTNLLLKAGAVIKWGERQLKGIVDIPDDYDHSQQLAESEDTLVTPKFVKAYSDLNYVSKKENDTIEGDITFKQDINVDGAAKVGTLDVIKDSTIGGNQSIQGTQSVQGQATFHNGARGDGYTEQGDIIQGWNIDKDGIASFAKVNTPSMQVYELTLNRKTAVQGEFVFSDGEVVENVEFKGAGTYLLTVRALYEGYITTFKKDDILYSNINIIGSSAKTGKCWMYVTAVDGNKITAVHYPYEACPAGENINPVPYMTITRHGNITDKTRQDLFIISSETSSLTMLRGVSAPIVSSEGLYGVVIGKLPATLLEYIHKAGIGYVNGEDPYVYARGVIVQDLIMLDYQGKPIVQERYRGKWRQDIANGLVQGEDTYQATASIADTVTYEGSLWRCKVSGTPVPPKDGIAEWQKKVSKGDDSTAVIYTLKPSSNIVYYRTASNTLSVDELTVKVSVAGNGEYYDIADQNTIEQAGLSVYYALDGEGEPILLNISPDGEILLEDGSGFIESEDGSDLLLEGEVLDITKIKDNITLYLKDLETGEMRASYVIPVIKDGEEGKRGRMLYPAGEWNADTSYAIENNSAPFVKEGSTHYVLVWEGSAVKGEKPSADKQGVYWRPFTYMNYLFAEFLVANWAQLGGKHGAVFYEKWLFSQTLQDGTKYTKDIINTSGQFEQGKYPKCAIDFLNGTSYMSNIIEPMNEFDGTVLRIDPTKGFNWFIPCNTETNLYDGSLFSRSVPCCKPLTILPTLAALKKAGYSDWDINGAHITITYGSGDAAYAGLIGIVAGGSNSSLATHNTYVANEFILVCVDEIALEVEAVSGATNLFKTNPKSRMLSYSGSNFFINNGKRARYLMMAPGNTLKLRPVVIGEKTIHWFIESDGVSSGSLTMYSTAYVIPDRKDTGNGDYRIRIHNKMDEVGYVKGYYDNVPTISVYASKESLGNSSIKDNLKDVQEGNNGSCVFVCGEPALLPNKIVISAQKKYNDEETNESRYCYRALFTEGADKKCDIVDFSQS